MMKGVSSMEYHIKEEQEKRVFSIDLLRIIAMLFIVINHYLGHGVAIKGFNPDEPFVYYDWYVRGISYMGTNLFILISAFFLSTSHFKTKHFLSLASQVWFYSILLFVVSICSGISIFTISGLVKAVAPIITSQYWFITCYIVLYFLAPFLNKLIDSLSQASFIFLLVILICCFCIVPSIVFFSSWLNWGGSSGIVWFVVLYLTGAYIRKYVDRESLKRNKTTLLLLTILLSVLPLISKMIIAFVTNIVLGYVEGSSIFFVQNSILLYPLSVCFFMLFLSFDITNRRVIRWIAFISAGVLSVYLITENNCIREWLWSNMSNLIDRSSCVYPVIELFYILMLFLACVLIDKLRIFVFNLISKTGFPSTILSVLSPILDTKFAAITND